MPSRSLKKKPSTRSKEEGVFLQVKVSRRAADMLRKRAQRALRSQASYLRSVIYRDLGIFDEAEG